MAARWLGTSMGDLAFGVQLLLDGGIVAVGTTLFNSTTTQVAVAQFRANGSFETNFGASGPGFTAVPIGGVTDDAAAIVVQPDGKLVVGGFIGPPVGDFMGVAWGPSAASGLRGQFGGRKQGPTRPSESLSSLLRR